MKFIFKCLVFSDHLLEVIATRGKSKRKKDFSLREWEDRHSEVYS